MRTNITISYTEYRFKDETIAKAFATIHHVNYVRNTWTKEYIVTIYK